MVPYSMRLDTKFGTMNQQSMNAQQEYYLSDYTFAHGPYIIEEQSSTSSPSPIMLSGQPRQNSLPLLHDQQVPSLEQFNYSLPPEIAGGFAYSGPYQSQPPPIVEFTDLTQPHDDRRRRRSQVKDPHSISTMHMRRRAQNRASQRAFRERKEKHAQDLQQQLEELQKKHQELQDSHSELDDLNKKLLTQLQRLRSQVGSPKDSDSDEAEE